MRRGTPITRCISGTLMMPAADAEQRRDDRPRRSPRRRPGPAAGRGSPRRRAGRSIDPRRPTALGGAAAVDRPRPAPPRPCRGGASSPRRRRAGRRTAPARTRSSRGKAMVPPTMAPMAVNSSRTCPGAGSPVALEVDAGGRAAGHDHADQRDADRLAQGQAEAEGEQGHEQDAAAQAEQRTEESGRGSPADHQQPDVHLSGGRWPEAGRPVRSATPIRAGGARGSRAAGRRGGHA